MEIFANCRLDRAGEPACGHPREFLHAAVAFVKTEGNYIARAKPRPRSSLRFPHEEDPESKRRKGKKCIALHSKASALRCDSLEIFPCRERRGWGFANTSIAMYKCPFINPADYFQNDERYFLTRCVCSAYHEYADGDF